MPSKKVNEVIVLKLREDLYTLAQTRENTLMLFFDVSSKNNDFTGVNLNNCDVMFCAFVADNRIKKIVAKKSKPNEITPSDVPTPRKMLSVNILATVPVSFSVDLVELGDTFESLEARLLKARLDPKADLDTIYKHEFTGMWGSTDKLVSRLIRYFDTGVNWDDQKSFVFPGIPLPSPSKK